MSIHTSRTNGSNAIKYNKNSLYEKERRLKKEAELKKRQKRKRAVQNINSLKMSMMILALVIGLNSLWLLNGYATLTNQRLEITRTEQEITEMQKYKKDLEAELMTGTTFSEIQHIVENVLGMSYAEPEDIVHLTVGNGSSYYVDNRSPIQKFISSIGMFLND